jgi:DNA-binding MarR family transcriptional regulator
VSQLADRLEIAHTTVSLMVGDLSRHGVLTWKEDDADRRRRIVAIAPHYAAPITEWLSVSAAAWTEVLAADARRTSDDRSHDARLRSRSGQTHKHLIRGRPRTAMAEY